MDVSAFRLSSTPPSCVHMDQSQLCLYFWNDIATILSCSVIGRAQTLTNQHWGHIRAPDLMQFEWYLSKDWRVNRISLCKWPLRHWHVFSPFVGLFGTYFHVSKVNNDSPRFFQFHECCHINWVYKSPPFFVTSPVHQHQLQMSADWLREKRWVEARQPRRRSLGRTVRNLSRNY